MKNLISLNCVQFEMLYKYRYLEFQLQAVFIFDAEAKTGPASFQRQLARIKK